MDATVSSLTGLAPYATDARTSRGRLVSEPPCPMRSPFQRDRDRILHSTAFRRLTYKTQVFVFHEGDHYRTRLTHTLEVAQIARALARQLRLDEDLAEALALAHDLGHPPFGHAGERALDAIMSAWGGFDHNAQSLRVVTELERKYAAFDGLNLTWETLEGIVKHNGPIRGARATQGDPTGLVSGFDARHPLDLDRFASAEAQAAAIADDIAYNNHDIDDGLRAGLLGLDALRDVAITGRYLAEVEARFPGLDGPRTIYEIKRRMITAMVADVVGEARRRIVALAPASAEAIRNADTPIVAFSAAMAAEIAELRAFLFTTVYRHARVMKIAREAESVVRDLASRFLEAPERMPTAWRDTANGLDRDGCALLVRDYVAGMTDRYAIDEHRRLFDATPDLR
jgi:dGTPase